MKAKLSIALGFIASAVVHDEIFTYLLLLIGLIAFLAVIIKAEPSGNGDFNEYYFR